MQEQQLQAAREVARRTRRFVLSHALFGQPVETIVDLARTFCFICLCSLQHMAPWDAARTSVYFYLFTWTLEPSKIL